MEEETGKGLGCIVLVTGASGFLGQHIIGLLQTRADHVTEIRVLDTTPYVKNIDYDSPKPVQQYIGSITDLDLVTRACRGAHSVMHLAGIVDIRMFPDKQRQENVNIHGTRVILKACREAGVSRLMFCSSVSVIYDGRDMLNITEDDVSAPPYISGFHYAMTKLEAERLVLNANDDKLTTLSIRPPGMYGEGDIHVLKYILDLVRKTGIHLVYGDAVNHMAYGGNVAWMFICAENELFRSSANGLQLQETIGGQAFFASDNSPEKQIPDYALPFYKACGINPVCLRIPLTVFVPLFYLLSFVLYFLRLFVNINVDYSLEAIKLNIVNASFSYSKARKLLGYRPLYTYHQANTRSLKYYTTVFENV